jgi:hypothetical protein
LNENRNSLRPFHIVEDDAIFSRYTEKAIDWVIAQGVFEEYDILYTDISLPILNDVFSTCRNLFEQTAKTRNDGSLERVSFRIFDLKTILFSSTSSYVVRASSAGKIADLLGEELSRGAIYPVDLCLRRLCLQGDLKICCLMPFATSVRLEHSLDSSIKEDPSSKLSAMAMDIARQSFFVDCDWSKCTTFADTYLPAPEAPSPLTQMLGRLLNFSVAYGEDGRATA